MNKKTLGVIVFLVAFVGLLFLASFAGNRNPQDLVDKENAQAGENADKMGDLGVKKDSAVKSFTMEEVSLHNKKSDCWLVIDNKVYDVTSFIALGNHPPQIEMGCGKDATKLFKLRMTEEGEKIGSGKPHSSQAESLRQNYYIGDLKLEQTL